VSLWRRQRAWRTNDSALFASWRKCLRSTVLMHEKVAMVGSALLSRRTLQVVTYTMVGKILHLTILLFPSHCTFFLTTIMYNFFLEGWKLPMVIYYFRKLKKRSPNKVRYKAVRIYWIRKYWIRKYVNESRNIDSTKASKLSPIYTHTHDKHCQNIEPTKK
jgi:hypothetical protein